jgi:hypothetical protein
VQGDQSLDGGQIERRLILAILDHAGEQGVAEILQHGQPFRRVQSGHGGRRQAQTAQMVSHRRKGLDPSGRQAGDGVPAARLALLGRPRRIAGRALGRRDLIHQHQRGAVRRGQPLIASRRGVARQGRTRGVPEAGGLQEVETLELTVRCGKVRRRHHRFSFPTILRQERSQDDRRFRDRRRLRPRTG